MWKFFKKSFKNIWWFNKNAILLSFGEVAEWSIAAVLKTVELRGSGGSNPSLSARLRSKKVSRNRYLLFLYLWRKFTCRQRCEKQKMGGLLLFAQLACKGPCGEQKGRALSGATIGSVVANSPSPLWTVYKELIFNLVYFFYAQKVAPKMHRPHFYGSRLIGQNLFIRQK